MSQVVIDNPIINRPFPIPETGQIAVKAINHYGDEVMKVIVVGSNHGR